MKACLNKISNLRIFSMAKKITKTVDSTKTKEKKPRNGKDPKKNENVKLFSRKYQPPGRGRPSLTEEQKALILATRTEFTTVLSKYLTWTKMELKHAIKNRVNDYPVLDVAIMTVLVESVIKGDRPSIDWILDHCFGKIDEKRKISIENVSPSGIDVSKLSDAQLAKLTAFMTEIEGEGQEEKPTEINNAR